MDQLREQNTTQVLDGLHPRSRSPKTYTMIIPHKYSTPAYI